MINFENATKVIIAVYVFMFVSSLVLIGTMVYVALHFIAKVW